MAGEERSDWDRALGRLVGVGLVLPVAAVLVPPAFDALFGFRFADTWWFALSVPFRLLDAVYIYWLKDLILLFWAPDNRLPGSLLVSVLVGAAGSSLFWGVASAHLAGRLRRIRWRSTAVTDAVIASVAGLALVLTCAWTTPGGPDVWENDGLDVRDVVLWSEQLIGTLPPRKPLIVVPSYAFVRDIPEYWMRYLSGLGMSAAFWSLAAFVGIGAVRPERE